MARLQAKGILRTGHPAGSSLVKIGPAFSVMWSADANKNDAYLLSLRFRSGA